MSRMLWWLEMMTQGRSTSSFRRPLTSKRRPYTYLKDRMNQLMILRGEGHSERRSHCPQLGGLGRAPWGRTADRDTAETPQQTGPLPLSQAGHMTLSCCAHRSPQALALKGDGESHPASRQPDGSTASGGRRSAKKREPTSTPTPQGPALTPHPCLLSQVRTPLVGGVVEAKTPQGVLVTDVPVPLWRLAPPTHPAGK